MFAVPGWTLTAPLKPQTVSTADPGASDTKPATATPPKKRKRAKHGAKVTSANVADLWAKHIDGLKIPKVGDKEAKKKIKDSKSKDKSRTIANDLHGDANNTNTGNEETNSNLLPPETSLRFSSERNKRKKTQKNNGLVSHAEVNGHTSDHNKKTSSKSTTNMTSSTGPPTKLTPLQASMRAKLSSARFRHLNETLYSTPSSSSYTLFSQSPEMFEEYHSGFRQQVSVWPENPVDVYIREIKKRGKVEHKAKQLQQEEPLPRMRGSACVIADFGCGDARLASELQPLNKKLRLQVHSFDLHNPSPLVTKADISSVPLVDASVDIGIFCLALMGTNWPDFIDEAFRVLRWKGELWVAEIKSRFGRVQRAKKVVDHSVGKRQKKDKPLSKDEKRRQEEDKERANDQTLSVEVDGNHEKQETDVSIFIEVLRRHGFVLKNPDGGEVPQSPSIDSRNKMFVRMVFIKAVAPSKGKNVRASNDGEGASHKNKRFIEATEVEEIDEQGVLKPCVYKLR